jgi:hypothetical protein
MPRPDREKEEQVLDLLEGSDPVERKDLEDALDFDEETTQSVIREMLYSGQLATTPDWKYEKREK